MKKFVLVPIDGKKTIVDAVTAEMAFRQVSNWYHSVQMYVIDVETGKARVFVKSGDGIREDTISNSVQY